MLQLCLCIMDSNKNAYKKKCKLSLRTASSRPEMVLLSTMESNPQQRKRGTGAEYHIPIGNEPSHVLGSPIHLKTASFPVHKENTIARMSKQ